MFAFSMAVKLYEMDADAESLGRKLKELELAEKALLEKSSEGS